MEFTKGEDINYLGNEVYTVAGGEAIVSFEEKGFGVEASPIRQTSVAGDSVSFASWGKNNDLPLVREQLVMENNIVPELLKTKRDLLLGGGLMLYKERFEKAEGGQFKRIIEECPIPNIAQEWIEENEMDEFHALAAKELIIQSQFFPEFVHKAGGDCVSVEVKECKYVRAEKEKKGSLGQYWIPSWFISGEWHKRSHKEVIRVANYNKKAKFQSKYIRRYADKMFGGPYYYSPSYWGSRAWIQLANCIPTFHNANIQNGYLIRYHIQYPKGYFLYSEKPLLNLTEEERKKVIANAKAKEEEFLRKVNEILVGVKNAGRTLFTTYDIEKMIGKEYPGVKVTAITVDLKDEALLKLFDKSNDANISAQGILPSISGVQSAGKLSSGSDIRNALAFYLATKTREPRRLLFGPINHIAKVNGWLKGEYEGCRFGARDVVIVTTDKDSKGIEENKNLN